MKFWLKNILSFYKNIFESINPNKTIKGIEKIEKKICGVFDLVLIFGCNGCGFMFKIYEFNFWFMLKIIWLWMIQVRLAIACWVVSFILVYRSTYKSI